MSGTLEETYHGEYEEDYPDAEYEPDEDEYDEHWEEDGHAQPVGLVYQTHSDDNYSADGSEFWKRMSWGGKEEQQPRNEPGDMRERGPWTFDGDFSYQPYSQMSCAYGLANIYRADHLDRVQELVKKHGRIFLFTVVNRTLLKQALARPTEFVPLCTTESWMGGKDSVVLFAAVNNPEVLNESSS